MAGLYTHSFVTGALETLSGAINAADTFEVNVAANFTAGDAISDYNGDGYTDILAINAAGTYNLESFSLVGIDKISVDGAGPWTLQITNAYAVNNYDGLGSVDVDYPNFGPGALFVDASAVIGKSLYLAGGSGPDTLYGGALSDVINAGSGADSLRGGASGDSIDAGSGADTLWGGVGPDTQDGGAGDDVFYIAVGDLNAGDQLIGGGDFDKIRLADGGGSFNLSLATLTGVEKLEGGTGADVVTLDGAQLYPGTSLAAVDLGADVDRLVINNAGAASYDFSTLGVSLANIEILQMNLTSAGLVYLDDAGGVAFVGGGGQDYDVYGGLGSDTIFTDTGDNYIDADAGADLVVAGDGVNNVSGGDGADTLFGGVNIDMMDGESGADLVVSGAGADMIYADSGADTIFAGDGGDVVWDMGADAVGILVVADALGESGDDSVAGNIGADTLLGGAGDDSLDGCGGADLLIGGVGADTLKGGPGGDAMWGEAGADVFLFTSGAGYDLIADFQQGQDKIRVVGFKDISTYASLQALTFITAYGNGVTVNFADGDQLAIVGVNGLSASDFVII